MSMGVFFEVEMIIVVFVLLCGCVVWHGYEGLFLKIGSVGIAFCIDDISEWLHLYLDFIVAVDA